MDVEGMENHVFMGGLKVIERYKPYILVEIKNFHRTQVLRWLIDAAGYRCHSVLSTNPSDFFCWHEHRLVMKGLEERKRLLAALEVFTNHHR